MQGLQEKAVASTLKALRAAGRLEPADDALVALVRGLAKAIDQYPTRASLFKEYLVALDRLAMVGGEKDTDAFAELLAELSASVGDTAAS